MAYLIPHCNIVSFPPAQHRRERGQLLLLMSRQHVLPQAVRHLEGDACEHVLHVFLRGGKTNSEAIADGFSHHGLKTFQPQINNIM